MAFKKGAPRPKNSGRKAGTPNKRNTVMEEAFRSELTLAKARDLIRTGISMAEKGKPGLLLGLMPYGLQEVRKLVDVTSGGNTIKAMLLDDE